MDVYIDVLFVENMIMNYLILTVTSRFCRSSASGLRMLAGAAVGAAYVIFVVCFSDIKVYYSVAAKFLLSIVIIITTFSYRKISTCLKQLVVFYAVTFMFAGAAFAFIYFNQTGTFTGNGIIYIYWKSKLTTIFMSAGAILIISRIFLDIVKLRISKEDLCVRLSIVFESRNKILEALIDTGNSLCDPISKTPVVVVEYDAIKDILPSDICAIFEEYMEDNLNCLTETISKSSWYSRFRVIPFTSLGMENGILLGFKPDSVIIGDGERKKDINNVIVGIYNKSLSKNEKYKALLGPELAIK